MSKTRSLICSLNLVCPRNSPYPISWSISGLTPWVHWLFSESFSSAAGYTEKIKKDLFKSYIKWLQLMRTVRMTTMTTICSWFSWTLRYARVTSTCSRWKPAVLTGCVSMLRGWTLWVSSKSLTSQRWFICSDAIASFTSSFSSTRAGSSWLFSSLAGPYCYPRIPLVMTLTNLLTKKRQFKDGGCRMIQQISLVTCQMRRVTKKI